MVRIITDHFNMRLLPCRLWYVATKECDAN